MGQQSGDANGDDNLSDLFAASIRDKLWHEMRHDLATFVPEIAANQLLMCCACGRFLPQDLFDLEHLIPQQSLKQDPITVKSDPDSPKNVRSGILLLCKKPLAHKGFKVHNNGCNSWKGRFYDKAINDLVADKAALKSGALTSQHIIAGLSLCYLAMVAEFGYAVVLMQSGVLMRRQFFSPQKYHPDLPLRYQMLLAGPLPGPKSRMWRQPFSFSFDQPGCCFVGARNFAANLPVSHDPRQTFAKHLRIVPPKYKLRTNFETFFD